MTWNCSSAQLALMKEAQHFMDGEADNIYIFIQFQAELKELLIRICGFVKQSQHSYTFPFSCNSLANLIWLPNHYIVTRSY